MNLVMKWLPAFVGVLVFVVLLVPLEHLSFELFGIKVVNIVYEFLILPGFVITVFARVIFNSTAHSFHDFDMLPIAFSSSVFYSLVSYIVIRISQKLLRSKFEK